MSSTLEPRDEELALLQLEADSRMLLRPLIRALWPIIRDQVLERAASILEDSGHFAAGDMTGAEAALIVRALKGRT